MKQLDKENVSITNSQPGRAKAANCATQLLEVTPMLMRRIRRELRSRTLPGLTMPQFRTLNYLRRFPKASLSDVAGHLGLTPPTTSKLVQYLVTQQVVERTGAADRRRISLSLTEKGRKALDQARAETRRQLADNLESLSQEELAAVSLGLAALGRAFTSGKIDENISKTV